VGRDPGLEGVAPIGRQGMNKFWHIINENLACFRISLPLSSLETFHLALPFLLLGAFKLSVVILDIVTRFAII
jgi:hypothetical protein